MPAITDIAAIANRIYYGGTFCPFIAFFIANGDNSYLYNIPCKAWETVANGAIMHFITENAREISAQEMWEILKETRNG
jgi:hypothetical protein